MFSLNDTIGIFTQSVALETDSTQSVFLSAAILDPFAVTSPLLSSLEVPLLFSLFFRSVLVSVTAFLFQKALMKGEMTG